MVVSVKKTHEELVDIVVEHCKSYDRVTRHQYYKFLNLEGELDVLAERDTSRGTFYHYYEVKTNHGEHAFDYAVHQFRRFKEMMRKQYGSAIADCCKGVYVANDTVLRLK